MTERDRIFDNIDYYCKKIKNDIEELSFVVDDVRKGMDEYNTSVFDETTKHIFNLVLNWKSLEDAKNELVKLAEEEQTE